MTPFSVAENPLGFSTLDIELFKQNALDRFNLEAFQEKMLIGEILTLGSRTFYWKLFLGVIPETSNPAEWVESIRAERTEFYRKTKNLSIKKTKDLDPNFFNPLAAATENNPWNSHFKDKEVRDLITQDIERTSQEFEFFTQKRTKDILTGILFLWASENQDIQYKQGMNEILAIIVFAYFAERVPADDDDEKLSAAEIGGDRDLLVRFIFNSKHTFADIYSTFNRILHFGIKNLYTETKDISELKNELVSQT